MSEQTEPKPFGRRCLAPMREGTRQCSLPVNHDPLPHLIQSASAGWMTEDWEPWTGPEDESSPYHPGQPCDYDEDGICVVKAVR